MFPGNIIETGPKTYLENELAEPFAAMRAALGVLVSVVLEQA
jgi:hypothetical protein